MTLGPVVSDGVCCAAGAADQEDDKNAHQKVQDPGGSAGSVLINVTVIGHSMNRKSFAKLCQIHFLLSLQLNNKVIVTYEKSIHADCRCAHFG